EHKETLVHNLLKQAQIDCTNDEQMSVNNRNKMADVQQAFREAERVYNLNQKLYKEKAIGSQEFEKSVNEYNYQKQRVALTKQILRQDSISNNQKRSEERRVGKE